MGRDFKQAIEAFKENGDRTIINDILAAIDSDFMNNKTRERVFDGSQSGGIRIDLKGDHEYVAYHIRAMQELLMRHVRTEHTDEIPGVYDFHRLLSVIYYDYGIKFPCEIYKTDVFGVSYFTINSDLFDALESHMSEIEEWFTDDEFQAEFLRLFTTFKAFEESNRAEVATRQQELEETTVRALEYALKYVDISKSEKEIVKYINMTFRSKLSDDEIKRNGMRRIQRKAPGGERQSFVVKPHFPAESKYVIFGTYFDELALTAAQREFIGRVLAIIETDKDNGDTLGYSCDTDGEVRISRKYIAERLGMREDLVRKKLERIKKRL
jgi:hypothetical protein